MLNEKQQDVVDYQGSLVNIAGPGSGKTHTLISKIASIVLKEKNIANNLLVLTFTNVAAQEIKSRALNNVDMGKDANHSNLFFGTYHSMFKRLLKENNIFPRLELGVNPTITMPKEIIRYVTNIIKNDYMDNFEQISNKAINAYYKHVEKAKPAKPAFNKTILKKELIDGNAIINKIDDIINYLTAEDIIEHPALKDVYGLIREKTVESLIGELEKNLRYARTTLKENAEKRIRNQENPNKEEHEALVEELFSSKTFGHTMYDALLEGIIDVEGVENQLNNYIKDFFENKFLQKIISFGDIMLLALYSLVQFDDFRNNMKAKFKYIFVDEFQDTNIIQGEILYLLHNGDNICVIGDPYQSIYGFLGAKIQNILNASQNFKANTIQLVENYRSNKNIVALTNELGVNMLEAIDNWKPCRSSNKSVQNNPIKLLDSADDDIQANFIVEKIKEFSPKTTFGIINRRGNVYVLENKLNQARLKYDKLGGEALGESAEIKMLIHLFIYCLSNDKIDSLLYVLDGMTGIGAKSIETFERDKLNTLKNPELKIKTPKKIETAIKSLDELVGENYDEALFTGELDLSKLSDRIKAYYDKELFPNLSKSWKSDRVKEAEEKIAILFDEIKEQLTPENILTLLEDYIIGSKKDDKDMKENITVTTIHSAKGLEWDVVFLMNWDNKIFERDDAREAQRLAYVAISRAREELFILSNVHEYFEISNKFIDDNNEMFININEEDNDAPLLITFGKHKGTPIESVPYNYLEWIYENQDDLLRTGRINKAILNKIEELFAF